jgi:hypothetical protein
MIWSRVKYHHISFESILLVLFLLLGIAVCQKREYTRNDADRRSKSIEVSINDAKATVVFGIQFYHLQKSWIPNRHKFAILSFNKSQFLDNKKIDQRILISDKIRMKFIQLQNSSIFYRLCPYESDEVPILS